MLVLILFVVATLQALGDDSGQDEHDEQGQHDATECCADDCNDTARIIEELLPRRRRVRVFLIRFPTKLCKSLIRRGLLIDWLLCALLRILREYSCLRLYRLVLTGCAQDDNCGAFKLVSLDGDRAEKAEQQLIFAKFETATSRYVASKVLQKWFIFSIAKHMLVLLLCVRKRNS